MVERLQTAGHTTYLVGGCVRDLLLGKHPKDYDIATMAKPNEVRRLIRNAYVIGKRFRLVLVKRGDQQYEVATFRRDLNPMKKPLKRTCLKATTSLAAQKKMLSGETLRSTAFSMIPSMTR